MPDSPSSSQTGIGSFGSDKTLSTMSNSISLELKEQIDRIQCDDGPQRGKSGD